MTMSAPELAAYQDQPKQLPSGSFGKNASLRLRFEAREDRSILAFSDRRAPLLVQRALYCDEGMPHLPVVFVITNSGGLLQGDRYVMEFEVGAHACAHVTTQAATKIHEMDANYAGQIQEFTIREGAYFEYMPDMVIPFRNSRFHTQTRINIDPTATLLYSEILAGGRQYYEDGELFQFDVFSSTVAGHRPDGRELFVEKFVIEPKRSLVRRNGVMGDFNVFGNVILLTPPEKAEAIHKEVAAVWNEKEHWAAGASRLPNDAGLIYKVVAKESSIVRAKIREFQALVRPQVTGFKVPPAFAWS